MPYDFAKSVQNDESLKSVFHHQAQLRLRELAAKLGLEKGQFEIRSNKGGVAVSGEITLHTDTMYIQVSQSCMGASCGVLIRRCKNRQDFAGGQNNFLSLDYLNRLDALADKVKQIEGLSKAA